MLVIRVYHSMPSNITTSRHIHVLTTFWHLKVQKGSAPADRGQAKSKRGGWVKQCEIPARDPTQSPKLPINGQRSACRPVLSLGIIYINRTLSTSLHVTCMASLTRNHQHEAAVAVAAPAAAAVDRGASGWDSAREYHPFSQRREPRTRTGDWIKPSIAEVLDRGGAAVEREEGPIPSHPHEGHCRPGYQVETAST